ncbi:hypothetical protein BJV78DRAFT_1279326 [Lactifluus subvellereus]|nr:hypothetical protein BJV78DRAFT_1279326 [Lactifluus subvellereus]
MSSRSLVSSWTATFVSSGTHTSPSPHKAYTGKLSRLRHRLPLLRHIHGLWKGVPPPNDNHPTLCRVSSNIGVSEPALVAEPTSTQSSPDLSPLSPTPPTPPTSASFSRGRGTGLPEITVSDFEAGDVPSPPSESHSRMLSIAGEGLFREPCRQPISPSSEISMLSPLASPGPSATSSSWCRVDAATRLQDFRALIAEMRITLFDYDFNKEFNSGDHGEEERERLLRLLEDVMRKVKQLAEKDTGFGSAGEPCSQVTTA